MRPRLLIVSGRPGAGKTTLATALARDLRLSLLTKDDIKERLADELGAADRAASRALGARAYELLYASASALLDAGAGCVLESNFERGRAENRLAPLVLRSRAALIMCEVPPELSLARYQARAVSGTRHPAHFDQVVLEAWSRGELSDHGTLALDVPVLVVDTSDGYRPPLAEVVDFVLRSSQDI